MQIEKIPMSNSDIDTYLPNSKILTNIDIQKYNDIDQIFTKSPKTQYIILLFIDDDKDNSQSGHWCCLSKYGDKEDQFIEFFDSYGNTPDGVYDFIDDKKAKKLGIQKYYLTDLLDKCKYEVCYNPIQYQSQKDDISTCGRHVVYRLITLLGKGIILPLYYKLLKNFKDTTKKNYDEIVSVLINL